MRWYDWVMNITLMLAVFIAGYLFHFLFPLKSIDGFYASTFDGEYICVDVEDMSLSRAYEVCRHEVGHEAFAETVERLNDTAARELFEYVDKLKGGG